MSAKLRIVGDLKVGQNHKFLKIQANEIEGATVPSTIYSSKKKSAHPVNSGSVVPGHLRGAKTRHQCRGQ